MSLDPESNWKAAKLKEKQLEEEIRASSATDGQKSDMLHTLSKLMMFAWDASRLWDVDPDASE